MLEDIGWTLLAYAISLVINIVPAFMPSTWMVLAFFHIQFDLAILPLTLGGALFSGLGRIVLARGSTLYTRCVRKRDKELDEIKTYLDRRRNRVGLSTFLYCLLPLPTNSLFVAAGMIEVSMVRVMIGFWAGRAIADTFYVWTTGKAFDSFGGVFEDYYQDWQAVALQLLGLAGALVLLVVPWPRWVFRWINRGAREEAGSDVWPRPELARAFGEKSRIRQRRFLRTAVLLLLDRGRAGFTAAFPVGFRGSGAWYRSAPPLFRPPPYFVATSLPMDLKSQAPESPGQLRISQTLGCKDHSRFDRPSPRRFVVFGW